MVAHCVGRRLEPLSHSSTSTSPWQVRVFVKDVLTSVGLIKTNYGLRTPLHMPLCTHTRTTSFYTACQVGSTHSASPPTRQAHRRAKRAWPRTTCRRLPCGREARPQRQHWLTTSTLSRWTCLLLPTRRAPLPFPRQLPSQ